MVRGVVRLAWPPNPRGYFAGVISPGEKEKIAALGNRDAFA
jgi:hypothetical protein